MSAAVLADSLLERNGTLIGIIVAAVTLVVSCWFTWRLAIRNTSSKTFDYRVQDIAILSQRPFDSEVRVLHGAEEIRHPRVVNVQFANSGSEVIRSSEILEPYALKVDTRPISVVLIQSSRPNLATLTAIEPVSGEPSWFRIPLTLETMNPGDNFMLQLIVDSEQPVETSLSGCAEKETRSPGLYTTEPHMEALTSEIRWASFGSLWSIGLGAWLLATAHGDIWNLAIGAVVAVSGLVGGGTMLTARAERKRRMAGLPASRALWG